MGGGKSTPHKFQLMVKADMKVGRNNLCPCGSGKKFKHCHGQLGNHYLAEPLKLDQLHQKLEALERVRQAQQGFGKPIISTSWKEHQVVAVGNTLHWSKTWKTFPDFLGDYLISKIGSEWGNAEIAKPIEERHPLMQWYDALCRVQATYITTRGQPSAMPVVGVVACYFSVAYGLYLLEHNVELQGRLIQRLKNPGNFQGAYYELMVASAFLLAGFTLTLEDETNADHKHCEFSAVSPTTKKKYWVEAKMRAIVGQLGRTTADGTNSKNPLSHMVKHLNAALAKPAADERMIFIDLNAEMPTDASDDNRPVFVDAATRRLERYEHDELKPGEKAYLVITNANFHKNLEQPAQLLAMPFGLGIPDFNRTGMYRLSERYRQEQVHSDALRVTESFSKILSFPSTFDGSLPSVVLHGELPPVVIGESYKFEGAGPNGEDIIGVVGDASVIEAKKVVIVAVNCSDGTSVLLEEPMSDQQLADYKSHPDAYFGKVVRPVKHAKTSLDLFEFFMDVNQNIPRDKLLEHLKGRVPGAEQMSDDELRVAYCEGLVSASGLFARPTD